MLGLGVPARLANRVPPSTTLRRPPPPLARAQEAAVVEDSDSEDDYVYNPLKLPLGWDGKPIPYWLYKLHGLNLEFRCEICGNASYWGRRAFERHFREWRHEGGMKALGITNSKKVLRVLWGPWLGEGGWWGWAIAGKKNHVFAVFLTLLSLPPPAAAAAVLRGDDDRRRAGAVEHDQGAGGRRRGRRRRGGGVRGRPGQRLQQEDMVRPQAAGPGVRLAMLQLLALCGVAGPLPGCCGAGVAYNSMRWAWVSLP